MTAGKMRQGFEQPTEMALGGMSGLEDARVQVGDIGQVGPPISELKPISDQKAIAGDVCGLPRTAGCYLPPIPAPEQSILQSRLHAIGIERGCNPRKLLDHTRAGSRPQDRALRR
jgi:hypothetical protein